MELYEKFWNQPVKLFLCFFVALNLLLFSVDRFLILYDGYLKESVLHGNDRFVYENICKNDTMRANLGEEYREFCEKAEVAVGSWVFLRAFKRVVERTHLCGDTPCDLLFERYVEIATRSMMWSVAAFLLGIILVLATCIYCGGCRRRETQHKVQTVDIESFSREDPVIMQITDLPRPGSYKEKTL